MTNSLKKDLNQEKKKTQIAKGAAPMVPTPIIAKFNLVPEVKVLYDFLAPLVPKEWSESKLSQQLKMAMGSQVVVRCLSKSGVEELQPKETELLFEELKRIGIDAGKPESLRIFGNFQLLVNHLALVREANYENFSQGEITKEEYAQAMQDLQRLVSFLSKPMAGQLRVLQKLYDPEVHSQLQNRLDHLISTQLSWEATAKDLPPASPRAVELKENSSRNLVGDDQK
jgi:hypothetical protein